MKPLIQKQIETALKDACESFVFSGYQVATCSPLAQNVLCGGKISYWGAPIEVSEETYFDLGSLTKVLLTTSVFARLVDQKKLDVLSTLEDHIQSFKGTAYAAISLKQLLTHSSGLIGWYPFYRENTKNLISVFLKNEKIFFSSEGPGTTIYSDLGFLLLGEVLRQSFGELNDLFQREVKEPLNLEGVTFGPLPSDQCAATEYCLERNKLIQGEVFDHNTDFLGGICSHAGLFSSAKSLFPWAQEWLNAVQGNSHWISQSVARQFIGAGQGNSSSSWAMGWDTKSKAFSSAGDIVSSETFGHLGFPGTSVWIDPKKSGVIVLLTNRVHPSRLDERIKRFRPLIHNLIAESWENHGS